MINEVQHIQITFWETFDPFPFKLTFFFTIDPLQIKEANCIGPFWDVCDELMQLFYNLMRV